MNVRKIQDSVCIHFDISRDELLQDNRRRKYARPRQIAMFLSREMTNHSLSELGQLYCRDHTTILHAIRAINILECDPIWAGHIANLRNDVTKPGEADRRRFELLMREKWEASIPFHLTPDGAAQLADYRQERLIRGGR